MKKIDFNIITNNNKIDDMNNDKIVCHNDNLANDMDNNTNHQNIQQVQATHYSLYTLTSYELRLNYDLQDLNKTDDWKSTNSHKSELIIAYYNRARNNTLHQKLFYVLYIKPNGDNNGHLIYDLSRDKIVVTTNYKSVPVPVDLFEPMNRIESSNNKIQVDSFNIKQPMIQMDYPINNECKSRSPNNNKGDSEDGDTNELGTLHYLDDLMMDKIVDHEN